MVQKITSGRMPDTIHLAGAFGCIPRCIQRYFLDVVKSPQNQVVGQEVMNHALLVTRDRTNVTCNKCLLIMNTEDCFGVIK